MATQAIAAYGVELRLGDGIPIGVGISAATNATPIVVTAPHGIAVGEVTWVTITGVTGTTAANGSWVGEALSSTTMKLRGSVGNGAYAGGGSMSILSTFTHIAELVNITPIGISFNMVAADAHDGGGWGTSIPTLKRGVDMRVEVNLVPSHPTHDETTGLIFLALNKIRRPWLIVLPDVGKTTVAFEARVTDHGTVTPIEGVLRSTPVLSVDGAMTWSYS